MHAPGETPVSPSNDPLIPFDDYKIVVHGGQQRDHPFRKLA